MLRPKLNRVWTSGSATLRRDPGDAKYIQGWVSEIPTFQVLNYLQYKVDTTLLAQAERGIFEWGTDIQYGLGSIVWNELDKKIYVSTVGSPSRTLAPSANLTQWSPSSIQVPRASYDTILAAINAHIANVTTNPHKLTAGMLNAYNKAEIDALVTQYRTLVSAHAGDKKNPHGVTASQVGAVPVTGGTYTGDVIFNNGIYFDAGKVNQISKAGGLFLQTGNFVLGIDSTGKPVAGTTTVKSPIVTESTFPALKQVQEVDYAIPAPVYNMPLMGDLNIYAGSGTTNIPNGWDAQFDSNGLILLADPTFRSVAHSVNPLALATEGTIALDIAFKDLKVSTSNGAIYSFGWGNGSSNFRILVDSFRRVYINPNVMIPAIMDTNKHRVVITMTPTNRKIYLDGVLVKSFDSNNPPVADKLDYGIYKYGTANAASQIQIGACNYRTWNVALTDKQVSNL